MVPAKSGNPPHVTRRRGAADSARRLLEGQVAGISGRQVIAKREGKLAELARIEPKLELTALAHPINETWMCKACARTRQVTTA